MPSPVSNLVKDIGEAVVQPTLDEGMRAVEQGVQSAKAQASAQNQNPQGNDTSLGREQDKKREEEELAKKRIHVFIKQMQSDEQRLRQLRQKEENQKEQEKQQEKEKEVKQFEVKKKQTKKQVALQTKQRRTEILRKGSI